MARGGRLEINVDYVKLANGDRAALRSVKGGNGGGHVGAMTAGIVATGIVFFPAAPLFLFMHGKDITMPKGAEFTAYVNGDMKASYPVLVHRLASLLHASFGPRLAASVVSPLRFAITSPPSGCEEDLHLQAVEHARHTIKGTGFQPSLFSKRKSKSSVSA